MKWTPGRIVAAAGAATLAALVAACGSSASTSTSAGRASPSAASYSPAPLPAGPFSLQVLHTGALSAAEQQQYGTTASRGVVYKVTDTGDITYAPELEVEWLNGTTVVGQGFAGLQPVLGPGQSETAEADDSLDMGGTGQPWMAVRVLDVELFPPGGSTSAIGTYAP